MESVLLDVAGHRRSPATMPGYHQGRPPRNKGEQFPADPPTVDEIIARRPPDEPIVREAARIGLPDATPRAGESQDATPSRSGVLLVWFGVTLVATARCSWGLRRRRGRRRRAGSPRRRNL